MQILTDACDVGNHAVGEPRADPAAVDAVLTASRSLVAVATRSLGAAAEETTIAQYRALVVLASRGPRRMADLAEALDVAPSTAGRMCDRLVRKGLVRRHRAPGDRRAVLVSVTPVLRFIPKGCVAVLRTARKLSGHQRFSPTPPYIRERCCPGCLCNVGRQSLTFTTPGSTSASPSKKLMISAWDRGTTGADAPW